MACDSFDSRPAGLEKGPFAKEADVMILILRQELAEEWENREKISETLIMMYDNIWRLMETTKHLENQLGNEF